MAEAARDLQAQDDPRHVCRAAARLAVANIDGADDAAISVVQRNKGIETLGETAAYVAAADRLQYELQEGPCLDAVWEERVVHSPVLAADSRWPRWASRVVDQLSVRSMMCFRLFTVEDTIGGLNLYARTDHAFSGRDREDGSALAAHIAVADASVQRITNLNEALTSRTVIAEAIGMLMERFELTPDLAFRVLTRVSTNSNMKLRDIAADIVARRDVPGVPTR